MSIGAQQEVLFFEEAKKKIDRLHSLIEQVAAARSGQEQMMQPIGRTAVDAQRVFMGKGYGVIADACGNIAMQAKRGGGMAMKIRTLRELVNSIKAAVDTRVKVIIAEESHKADAVKEKAANEKT